MSWSVWLAYVIACGAIALSPGSGAVLCMSHGLDYGLRKTSSTIAGLQVGLALVMLIAGVGVGAVLVASSTAFMVIKVVGAGYLMWLGYRQWTTPLHTEFAQTQPHPPSNTQDSLSVTAGASAARAARGHLTASQRFALGLGTNLTNPKSILFMVAVLPQFWNPDQSMGSQLLILMLTLAVIDTIVMHGYALLAERAQVWLHSTRARRLQNGVLGSVLMAMGLSLLWVKKSQ